MELQEAHMFHIGTQGENYDDKILRIKNILTLFSMV